MITENNQHFWSINVLPSTIICTSHLLILCLHINLWSRCCYYDHLTDKKTESPILNELTKFTRSKWDNEDLNPNTLGTHWLHMLPVTYRELNKCFTHKSIFRKSRLKQSGCIFFSVLVTVVVFISSSFLDFCFVYYITRNYNTIDKSSSFDPCVMWFLFFF